MQWHQAEDEGSSRAAAARQAIDTARERRARLIDAYVYQSALPETDYRERLVLLDREILEAEEHLATADAPALGDLGGLLDYAENLVTRADESWRGLEPDLQRRFQHLVFPRGIAFDPANGFGASDTCLLFSDFEPPNGGGEGMVSPTGFEPVFPP